MAEVQFVIFSLGSEEYGVDIMQVREIVIYREPVRVPNTPSFVEGIVNLRGDIIPIVNLKDRFNVAGGKIGEQTRIIVMNIGSQKVGFIVDEASEVVTIDNEDMEEAPEIVSGEDREYISGIGKVEERILIILDLNKLFTEKEKKELETIEEQ